MTALLALSATMDISVDQTVVVVGRHPGCDAHIDSQRVSRWHCVLAREGEHVLVRDLGSRNGTWINGCRVTSGRLKPGDRVAFGQLFFQVAEVETTATHLDTSLTALGYDEYEFPVYSPMMAEVTSSDGEN
jgi:pSer/pThr/pTyr-binding forkhead associated (FHA) protein